jgi:signal transduction histidine kinase
VFSVLRNSWLVFFDMLAALVLLALVGYAAFETGTAGSIDEPAWVSLAAATLIAGPVWTRRRAPLTSLAVSLSASVVAVLTGVVPMVAVGGPMSAAALVVYLVASDTPRWRSVFALVASLGTVGVLMLVDRMLSTAPEPWEDSLFGLSFAWLIIVTAWSLGFAARERRRHAEEMATRQTEQAVAEERLRIARELHDIVAHSMSLIAVKAGIGNHVAEQRPAEAREALRVIEATSRSSMAEMRHLLGVLRSEVDGAERAPAPGPAGIPALVERARSAGSTVSLVMDGLDELPEGLGLSVYRIVQEALTNVVRHAPEARCEVTLSVRDDTMRVEVVNDGPRVTQGPGGHGLIGMRERVAVYGGTFEAGPRHAGGWRVSAVLPR